MIFSRNEIIQQKMYFLAPIIEKQEKEQKEKEKELKEQALQLQIQQNFKSILENHQKYFQYLVDLSKYKLQHLGIQRIVIHLHLEVFFFLLINKLCIISTGMRRKR